jgi:hypothetical protein
MAERRRIIRDMLSGGSTEEAEGKNDSPEVNAEEKYDSTTPVEEIPEEKEEEKVEAPSPLLLSLNGIVMMITTLEQAFEISKSILSSDALASIISLLDEARNKLHQLNQDMVDKAMMEGSVEVKVGTRVANGVDTEE